MISGGPIILLLFFFFFFFFATSRNVGGEVPPFRQASASLSDFLLEEVLVDSFVNPMSSIPDDRSLITEVLDPIAILERDVSFLLYTRDNPTEPLALRTGDAAALKSSSFNKESSTKIVIHGWTDTGYSDWMQDFRRNYLRVGDYNVILVDWSPGSLKEYFVASKLTRQVGDYISRFVEFLVAEGVASTDRIHLLGHSLGAHIAGFVGSNMSGSIGRITGMDPARPDFEAPLLREPRDRLDPGDARFVDVIHTCAGTVGFVRPIGHADFYPNGGSFRQPGCPVFMSQYCSHGRSHQFMGETIINPLAFPAIECYGWKEYKSNKCDPSKSQIVYMGEKLNANTRGVFFLETNTETPFGRGELL